MANITLTKSPYLPHTHCCHKNRDPNQYFKRSSLLLDTVGNVMKQQVKTHNSHNASSFPLCKMSIQLGTGSLKRINLILHGILVRSALCVMTIPTVTQGHPPRLCSEQMDGDREPTRFHRPTDCLRRTAQGNKTVISVR